MRLLPDIQRKNVLDSICKHVQTNTRFQAPDCDLHIQVIPGATEGLYGWVAANYLLGGFDFPKDHDHGKDHDHDWDHDWDHGKDYGKDHGHGGYGGGRPGY